MMTTGHILEGIVGISMYRSTAVIAKSGNMWSAST